MDATDSEPPGQAAGDTRGGRLKLGQIAVLILAVAISIAVLALTTRFREELQQVGSAGLIGLFAISVLSNATLVIPAPGYVFACAAGTVFNFAAVGVVAGLGSAVGELTGYMAGYGGNAVIPRGRLYDRLHAFMLKHGALAIFLLAAVPNPIFDIGGMLAGMTRLPVWKFLLAAWAGKSVRLGLVSAACLFGIPALQQLLAPR